MQVQAIDAWVRRRGGMQACGTADGAGGMTAAADLRREVAKRLRERDALLARVDDHLRLSGAPLAKSAPVRAIVAHDNMMTRTAFASGLTVRGISVVGLFADGAQALGTAVAEQPDLVLVEDRPPTLPALEVVRLLREFAPSTVVAAVALQPSQLGDLLEAGARCVFTRVPPDEVVAQLVTALAGDWPCSGSGPAAGHDRGSRHGILKSLRRRPAQAVAGTAT
jgi:CheY-like chemotaxis protein